MAPVIHVEHLSKEYRLGTIGHGTLYRDVQSWWARLRGRDDPNMPLALAGYQDTGKKDGGMFSALDDVSFQVERGETLAIIGANGAGKSTLLKILSRIASPTRGCIVYEDRIASLLEVGTGFHVELTGRENIFMNGAMLGMRRSEIAKKFEEIVEFSGIGPFIDTPVKRYSSGMYVRLAFAVAAHLEAEILLVDEVLAVGDMEFQKKCLGKMQDVSQRQGRTVLFVSHNMSAVRRLCRRAVVLEKGRLILDTEDVPEAIRRYHGQVNDVGLAEWINERNAYENPYFKPHRAFLADPAGQPLSRLLPADTEVSLRIEGVIEQPNDKLVVGYLLHTDDDMPLFCSYNTDMRSDRADGSLCGSVAFCSPIPIHLLNEGTYRLELWIHLHPGSPMIVNPAIHEEAILFTIGPKEPISPHWGGRRAGALAPVLPWTLEAIP